MMKAAAKVFRALADPTRRQILEELKHGPLSAGEIASRLSVSAPAISRHLSLLQIDKSVKAGHSQTLLCKPCVDSRNS
jgi:DNA-binding transcriptional ArsR family regulator